MFRGLLSNRLIQVGLIFFVVVVGGSLLYSWHVQRTSEAELEQHDQLLPGLEKQNKIRRAEAVNAQNANETDDNLVETSVENTKTASEIPEEITAFRNEADLLEVAEDAFLPDDIVSSEEPVEDISVLPYGFGPYPELPEGWPADIWPRKSADHELMLRVQIKLISQGKNAFGATMENGLVYPTIDNTVYIRWDGETGDRYISEIAGDPDACDRLENIIEVKGDDFTEADIPSDIKIVTYEDGGINPYTFLNLP